jgi:hypothetical protein
LPEKRIISLPRRGFARWPDVEFQIVGDGPCRDQLMAQARDAGVLSHIEFIGHRDDVPAILAGADLFVLPSESEASPTAIFDAMAAGLPVVASRVGGIPELVADGVTGLLVPPADPDALAAAVLDLLDQPGRAMAFGKAAWERIEQQYARADGGALESRKAALDNPRTPACALLGPRPMPGVIGGQERVDDDLPASIPAARKISTRLGAAIDCRHLTR